ncbi:MAG: glycine cleavage system protein GcvH [Nannocystales bacterium]
MSEFPADLRYTKEHEWARKEGDLLVVGITSHAVEQLGDITMVTLPEAGTALTVGETFGDVDSVKAVSELYAPVDGEVVEINAALEDAPESVNEAPYEGGWMLKIKPSDPAAFEGLMDVEAYTKLTADG